MPGATQQVSDRAKTGTQRSGLSVQSISAFPAEETSVVSDLESRRIETEWGCPVSPALSSTTTHATKDASG